MLRPARPGKGQKEMPNECAMLFWAYNGSLKTIPAPDLGAAVVRETLGRLGLEPHRSAASSWATSSGPATR
jgi:hypothetical protein